MDKTDGRQKLNSAHNIGTPNPYMQKRYFASIP